MRNFITCFLVLVLVGCRKSKEMTPSEFKNYATSEESGYRKIKEISGVQFISTMETPQIIAIKANEDDGSEGKYLETVERFKSTLNFILTLKDNASQDVRSIVHSKQNYARLLAYSNTDLKKDFVLIIGNDTSYCSVLHMESANSINSVIRISTSFKIDSSKLDEDVTLVFHDHILNNGPLKFKYSSSVLKNQPTIKF